MTDNNKIYRVAQKLLRSENVRFQLTIYRNSQKIHLDSFSSTVMIKGRKSIVADKKSL